MTYAEKLRDPRWQRRRLQVLDKADWMCEECGDASSEMHVHHKIYRKGRLPWGYEIWEYRALCLICHRDETQVRQELAELMIYMDIHELNELRDYAAELANKWLDRQTDREAESA